MLLLSLLPLLLLSSAQCVRLFADEEKRVAAAAIAALPVPFWQFASASYDEFNWKFEQTLNEWRETTAKAREKSNREGRREHSKSIANLKTNLPQRNSKRKRRRKWEVKGSTAKLSQRKLRFNSFEFVSLSLSLSISLFLSACLSLTLTLSCRWSSVNVRLNVTLRMRHVVRCTSTWHNWQRLAHSSVPLSLCLSVCAPCSLAVWATFARMSSAVCLVQFSLCGRYTKNNRRTPSPTIWLDLCVCVFTFAFHCLPRQSLSVCFPVCLPFV